jgi:hypothetical protein
MFKKSEAWRNLTFMQGFNSMLMQQVRQMPGQLRRGEVRAFATNVWMSILIPAFLGEILYGTLTDDDAVWWRFVRAVPNQLLQLHAVTKIIQRGVQSWQTGGLPFEVAAMRADRALGEIFSPTDKFIEHTLSVVPGVGNQPARTAQYLYDLSRGAREPQDWGEALRGLIWNQQTPPKERNPIFKWMKREFRGE